MNTGRNCPLKNFIAKLDSFSKEKGAKPNWFSAFVFAAMAVAPLL